MEFAKALRAAAAALAITASTATQAAEFHTVPGRADVVFVDGPIIDGDDAVLARFLTLGVDKVGLNSPGGLVAVGSHMASAIAGAGAITFVNAESECASSCVLVFAAGARRFHQPGAMIGVHSAADSAGYEDMPSMATTTFMARELRAYGMSAAVVGKLVTTPNDSITWLTEADLVGFSEPFGDIPAAYAPTQARPLGLGAGYAMSCRSTATGNYYEVLLDDDSLHVGKRTYSVSSQHPSRKRENGNAWVIEGTTQINTDYAAVFGGTKPRMIWNDGREVAVDWCN